MATLQESGKLRYPENLELRGKVAMQKKTVGELAKEIGVSRHALSETINGHKKGVNIVPKLLAILEPETSNPQ